MNLLQVRIVFFNLRHVCTIEMLLVCKMDLSTPSVNKYKSILDHYFSDLSALIFLLLNFPFYSQNHHHRRNTYSFQCTLAMHRLVLRV